MYLADNGALHACTAALPRFLLCLNHLSSVELADKGKEKKKNQTYCFTDPKLFTSTTLIKMGLQSKAGCSWKPGLELHVNED